MSLELRGPDGHQKLVVHTDKVLWSDFPWDVVKATLDKCSCAARILKLRPLIWFLPPASQVEQDYQIWRDLKHPNIVQFLGSVQDPRKNHPIILMELMEQRLNHFLHTSSTDIPYHVQVNISNDIAQAVDYLHSNGILHGDLTSNNILLNAHYQAKVTGFGNSANVDSDPSLLHYVYSDCFSVGNLILYIATRINVRTVVSHGIDHRVYQVPTFHGFLPVIRDCLKDKSEDRPSAAQLCQRLGQLKTTAAYRKSLTDPSFQV